jgi:hypothetical protein
MTATWRGRDAEANKGESSLSPISALRLVEELDARVVEPPRIEQP